MNGKVIAISVSSKKGIPKTNTGQALLIENLGIKGDAHAVGGHRQISLLANESIDKIRNLGLANIQPGIFAENITTENINLMSLVIGDRIQIGYAELEITQIGKECHNRCAIYNTVGDCVMPKEGIFARVLKGGMIKIDDNIEKLNV